MSVQEEIHCERCGAILDEQAIELGHCIRCGKRVPKALRTPATQPTRSATPTTSSQATSSSATTEPRLILPYRIHTDGAGVFYVYVEDERNYEFLKGAGCEEAHITATMITLVRRDLDVQGKVVSSTSFFESFSRVLEYYKDRLEVE
jgi:hypothetical protein